MNKIIQKMSLTGLLAAVTFLATFYIRIDLSIGYLNLGDAFIIFAAVFIDPISGGVVGLIGATLADLLGGSSYAVYAPFTAVIKFAEGLIAGYLFRLLPKKINFFAFYIAGFVMAILYGFTNWLLWSWQGVPLYFLLDALQGILGASVAIILLEVARRTHLMHADS